MENPIHLYRHLLRHAGALYDDVARTHALQYIRRSFERHRTPTERTPVDIDQSRRWLSTLRRANSGVYKPLVKVLRTAYGRRGPRRHELLKPLMTQVLAEPSAEIQSEPSAEIQSEPSAERASDSSIESAPQQYAESVVPPMSPQLQALVRAHKPGVQLRPKIPELNSWGRLLPQKRVANIERKYRAALLQEVHAPLPANEYARLERFATGEERPEPPKRKASLKEVEIDNPKRSRMAIRSWRKIYRIILEETPQLVHNEDQLPKWRTKFSDVLDKQPPLGIEDDFQKERLKVKREKRRKTTDEMPLQGTTADEAAATRL